MAKVRRQLHVEFWNVTPHFETAIEIALRSQIEGTDVSFASWGRYFKTTEIYHRGKVDLKREALRLNKLGERGIRICAQPEVSAEKRIAEKILEDCRNIHQLETLFYKNMPVGKIVKSFLIDRLKTVSPTYMGNRMLVLQAVWDLVNIYEASLKEIVRLDVERVVVFNGRYLGPSAVRFAAESINVDIGYHERGPDFNKYIEFPTPVHNCRYWWYILKDIWASKLLSNHEALEAGKTLFLKRNSGANTNWLSFTGMQTQEAVTLSEHIYRITYFSSSPYEYKAIYDSTLRPNGLFGDESTLFNFLRRFAIENSKVQVVIRMHPNLQTSSEMHKQELEMLYKDLDGLVTVIRPESQINTYSLLQHSDIVVTSGSTCGVEGLCLGKKVVNLAPALYSYLDSVREPETIAEFYSELLSPGANDDQKAVTEGYQYFYSYSSIGCSFKHYKPLDHFNGSLALGEDIR